VDRCYHGSIRFIAHRKRPQTRFFGILAETKAENLFEQRARETLAKLGKIGRFHAAHSVEQPPQSIDGSPCLCGCEARAVAPACRGAGRPARREQRAEPVIREKAPAIVDRGERHG